MVTSDPVARYLSKHGSKFDRKNRLRTMSSGEILDSSLRIYQRLGLTFLRLTAAPALLCLAAFGFFDTYVSPRLFTTKSSGNSFLVLQDLGFALALALLVGGPLVLIGVSYASSVVVHLVSSYLTGNEPDEAAAVQTARQVLPRLFLVNLKELMLSLSGVFVSLVVMAIGGFVAEATPQSDSSAGVISVIGIMGLCAGGLIFLAIIALDALAVPIAVLEGAGAKSAGKRSRSLLRRVGYHPSGTSTIWSAYMLLLFMATVLFGGLALCLSIFSVEDHLSSALSALPGHALFVAAVDLLPTYAILWVLIPVWAVAITIVYYERRIRLEGFDIDELAAEIPKTLATSTRR